MKKILYTSQTPFIKPLFDQLSAASHLTCIAWALECATEVLPLIKTYCADDRIPNAIYAARSWARGDCKMPIAKRAILDCHAIAKEQNNLVVEAFAHAIGHAAASVHVKTHAPGFLFYFFTALERLDPGNEDLKKTYVKQFTLLFEQWSTQSTHYLSTWAPFLKKKL